MSDAHKSDDHSESGTAGPAPLHGILAEYESPPALIAAAKKVRDAGFTKWDTYTPFPVHGIDKAMDIKFTVLPWLVFFAGLTGLATATLLQWWTNTVDYPWIISGKPMFTIPANVPIMFELTVLFSAITAFVGMLMLNKLPHPSHPLDLNERFARATDDRFFLMIQANDVKFDDKDVRALLDETHPTAVEDVLEDRVTSDKLPPGLIYALVIVVVASLVPFALFAKARHAIGPTPRLHAVWDMDFQPKYKTQRENPLFDDRRAMRVPSPGTVPVGELNDDEHLYQGKLNGVFALTLPPQVEPTAETMARGKQRFGIYCAPCHGLDGTGEGMVHKRAVALGQGTWIQPSNLHQEYIRTMPVGKIFDSITHGIRNMPAYGAQVDPTDRWAIILYMRALEKSRAAKVSELSESERSQLK